MEEIIGIFNDHVAVQLTHLTEEEKKALEAQILQSSVIEGKEPLGTDHSSTEKGMKSSVV